MEKTNAFGQFESLPAAPVSGDPFVRGFAGAASPGALAHLAKDRNRNAAAEALALACLQPTAAGFAPSAACALASRVDGELAQELSPEAAQARDLNRVNKAAFAALSAMKTEKGPE
jgi:hypothetical protein